MCKKNIGEIWIHVSETSLCKEHFIV